MLPPARLRLMAFRAAKSVSTASVPDSVPVWPLLLHVAFRANVLFASIARDSSDSMPIRRRCGPDVRRRKMLLSRANFRLKYRSTMWSAPPDGVARGPLERVGQGKVADSYNEVQPGADGPGYGSGQAATRPSLP